MIPEEYFEDENAMKHLLPIYKKYREGLIKYSDYRIEREWMLDKLKERFTTRMGRRRKIVFFGYILGCVLFIVLVNIIIIFGE